MENSTFVLKLYQPHHLNMATPSEYGKLHLAGIGTVFPTSTGSVPSF